MTDWFSPWEIMFYIDVLKERVSSRNGINFLVKYICFGHILESYHLELTILEITSKISSYLEELIISENSWLFFKTTSSRWQDENNRQLFSVTDIDDQGLSIYKFHPFYNYASISKHIICTSWAWASTYSGTKMCSVKIATTQFYPLLFIFWPTRSSFSPDTPSIKLRNTL